MTKKIDIAKVLPKILTLREQPTYNENPFIVNDELILTKVRKSKIMRSKDGKSQVQTIVDANGNITGESVFYTHTEVDEEQFAKIYIAQLSVIFDLPRQSQKVFEYILTALKPNDDKVYFDINECSKVSGYESKMSIYMGLNGLIDAKIIARTKRNYQYFINPKIAFNGSRIVCVNNIVKKGKIADKNQVSMTENINFLNES